MGVRGARSRPAVLLFCTVVAGASGCASTGEEDDGSSSFGQAVGIFAAVVGAAAGDQSLSNKGLETYKQSLGTPAAGGAARASVAAESGPSGGNCLTYLRRQRMTMLQNARQCQVNEALMSSFYSESAPLPPLKCGGISGYIDQRIAQQACGRVYMCATAAYTVAIRENQAGANCQAAMQTGLARYPVPQPR